MGYPENKNVLIFSVPTTFVGEMLCPLGVLPIGILKLAAFLKKKGNRVEFINMYPPMADKEDLTSFPVTEWKEKPMGLEEKRTAKLCIAGKSFEFFEDKLNRLPFVPDEIWASSSFTFDYDLVKEYIIRCRRHFPKAKIVAGGDFARAGGGAGKLVGADEYSENRILEADSCLPDFSFVPDLNYGLFQLQTGCVNKCSFCHINMDKPEFYNVDRILGYMQKFYDERSPKVFMNWDPNVSLNRPQLTEFLQKYRDSGMEASITFGKGLQPNLVDADLLNLMHEANVTSFTIPMESADYEASKRLSKPYTIISSVKLLAGAKKAGIPLKYCRCTSLLGYPDDDLHSFFRIFLTVLSFGANPSPFPVYLFPGAPDYLKFKKQLGRKDISSFHGQLWPLLPDSKIDEYRNLFRFIEISDMRNLKKNVSLLSPEMRDILGKEAANFRKFTERCLEVKKDSLEEFKKINEDLEENTMRTPVSEKERKRVAVKKAAKRKLLCIVSNPGNPRRSVSKAMGEYYLKKYMDEHPGAEITKVDLCSEGLPFLNEEYVDYIYYGDKKEKFNEQTSKLLKLVQKYVKQLKEADDVIFVTPMYTLAVPAILKAYFETVASYSYYLKKELFQPKNVLCLISRDGVYPKTGRTEGDRQSYLDAQETVLAAAIGFLGLSQNPDFIDISNLYSKKELPQTIRNVKERIDRYVQGDKTAAYRMSGN
ncbi:MAG: NAD(P)H-dependent oxidoreductase [Elusimicrobiales bacterium]|nr:NAD(P)H-dependent oxidoreductase [Elusimicrobiales bacterium]